MKPTILSLLLAGLLSASQVWAVPVLQVGAPAAGGTCADGPYVTYQASTINPTETDTAITTGSTICVAGVYGNNVLNLGGQYSDGDNWSVFGLPDVFNTIGAVLLVSVPEGTLASALASLKVDGVSAFYSDAANSYFPNQHDPVKSDVSDFLFFDLGNFSKNQDVVPNLPESPVVKSADGEIKSLLLSGLDSLTWLHFDVMALESICDKEKGDCTTTIKTTNLENNPGSHDLTWKKPNGGGGDDDNGVPEPGVLFLMGAGLLGLGMARRRKSA